MKDSVVEDIVPKTFSVYPRHIVFLEDVNENTSLALRTVLDSVMNGRDQMERKQLFDNSILFVALGIILFFLSYTSSNFFVNSISILLGVALVGYGAIGGAFGALRSKKHGKR